MRDIRIGNDFTIKWSLYKNDGETRTPYEVTGAAVLKLCSAYGTREVYGWQASGNTIVWTFRGADQRHLGPYQLVYIENDGKPNMITVDTCDAFCLVSQSCQQSDPSELLMLESDIVFAEVRMIDDELSATSLNAISNRAVTEALGKKVDAVPGKGLSTEDFTTAEKEKLAGLKNYDDSEIKEALNEKQDAIPDLETIRQGAQKGATALQEHQDISHLATKQEVEDIFPMKMVTYADLVAMRDKGRLVPGQQYRIIDFVTTVDQVDAKSAGHQFDVIVTADGPSVLNEKARAAISEGDTYFTEAGANLKAWQLWYCLDNDRTRFAWADTENGRGVIYRMIDEHLNDVPYDFKNIQYKEKVNKGHKNIEFYEDGVTEWMYTFSCIKYDRETGETLSDIYDGSIVSPYGYMNDEAYYNTFVCNKIGPYYSWYDVDENYQNTGICELNNIIMLGVVDVNIGVGESLPSTRCCSHNEIGDQCNDIKISKDNYFNKIGGNCSSIRIMASCRHNTIDGNCCDIYLREGNRYHNIGRDCCYITIDEYCDDIKIGFKGSSINIGLNAYHITIGGNCRNIDLLKNQINMRYITIGDGCVGLVFNAPVDGNSFPVANYHIDSSVGGEEIDLYRNRGYTTYITLNSNGDLRELCLGDMSVS